MDHRFRTFTVFLALLLGTSACQSILPDATATPHAAPTLTAAPLPVIIDTDMAADDWMAILYLLQRTDIAVQAITVTGTGEAHCDPGVQNALGLVALADHPPVPVACGRQAPLAGQHVFPDDWRRAVDSLMGLSLPEGQNPASGGAALDLLATTLSASPEKITILSLGPLTNLGELFQSQPEIIQKVRGIYSMGGAVQVAGNMESSGMDNQVAEWNIYVDPHAANLVFASGAPVSLVPLDATNHAPITMEFYKALRKARLTPEAGFVYEVLNRQERFIKAGGYYFWDPLAAAVLADESLATWEQRSLCVIEEEGPTSGQTVTGADCPAVRVAVSADRARFEEVFVDVLNNP